METCFSVVCPLSSDPWQGAVAQLGERLLCTQEVVGSIPIGSTSSSFQRSAFSDQLSVVDLGLRILWFCRCRVWRRRAEG